MKTGITIGLCLCLLTTVACHDDPDGRTRHILLISVDALRADHLSCDGHFRHTTPFLDRLAAEGTRFTNAFVNTHGTPPSHTTMLSSLYQETHGVGIDPDEGDAGLRIPADVALVQELLQAEDWNTVAVTGGGYVSGELGFARGFDRFSDDARDVEQGTTRLLDELRQLTGAGPVFAFYHTYQVHSPYLPPESHRGMFGHDDVAVDTDSASLLEIQTTAGKVLSRAQIEAIQARYDEEIRYTDGVLERFFADLDAIGFLDDALVIVTADHGEEFADHGWLLHGGRLYEELIRVPLIVWGHRVESGAVNPALVSSVDLAPTVLGAARLRVPEPMEGRDLLALSPRPESEQRVFAQYGRQWYAVRTPRWKLLMWGATGGHKLFDLHTDPKETRNVKRREPEIASQLMAELYEWRQSRTRIRAESGPAPELSDERRQQLEALGYVESRPSEETGRAP